MSYLEFIMNTRLIRDEEVEVTLTTGDVPYPGTSYEVTSGDDELFYIVVDESGSQQVLFLAHENHYRLTLSLMERIVSSAKEKVRYIPDFDE